MRQLTLQPGFPAAGFNLRQQPIAHKEQHHHGDQHGNPFQQLPTGAGAGKHQLENDRRRHAGNQRDDHRLTNQRQLVVMVIFHQPGHDGRHNQQRLQPFTDNNHQAV